MDICVKASKTQSCRPLAFEWIGSCEGCRMPSNPCVLFVLATGFSGCFHGFFHSNSNVVCDQPTPFQVGFHSIYLPAEGFDQISCCRVGIHSEICLGQVY